MKTVALIGCGALGRIVARELPRLFPNDYRLVAVMARNEAHALEAAAPSGAAAETTLEGLLAHRPDLVVELAGRDALTLYAEAVLRSGSDLAAVSVGAFADEEFRARVERTARAEGRRIFLPNGAVGGLDLLQTYALMGGARLEIENVKAPKSLEGAPGLAGRNLPEHEATVFEGGVREAIEGFPKNVNVAVAASLAASAPDARVRVVSRPGALENVHRLTIRNDLMRAELTIASKPDPTNPKSSTSTAWSVLALLKNLAVPIVFF